MLCPILKLAKELIERPSISPYDAGCQAIISDYLKPLGFQIESMLFGNTHNLWACRGTGTTLVFVGHTDVVPIGDEKQWITRPFDLTLHNGMLYGRGIADMKGALAAMVIAAGRFIKKNPNHKGKLAFLITSDEESSAQDGTKKVVNTLLARHEKFNYCLVGEPSSKINVGDIIKNGRRGSLTANLLVYGVQGHIAYPHLADNPIHRALSALNKLIMIEWDYGNLYFPPTTMQIVNIYANSGSTNIIPNQLKVTFNFRFSNELNDLMIRNKVDKILCEYIQNYHIDWLLSAKPFLTTEGNLLKAVQYAVKLVQNITPRLETTGGTSDGRFFANLNTEVIELGLVNETIHKVNECIKVSDLQLLSNMYQCIMEQLIL